MDQDPSAAKHLLQENLEAAEDASKEAIATKEALHSKLSQAIAAESGLRSKCNHLEMQATSTASQLQEMQQQVVSSVYQHARCAVILCCKHTVESSRTQRMSARFIHLACRQAGMSSCNGRVLQCMLCDAQVSRADELHQQATKYCAQLQEFNGRLQSDSQAATERLKTLQASTRPPANVGHQILVSEGIPAQCQVVAPRQWPLSLQTAARGVVSRNHVLAYAVVVGAHQT